MSSILVLFGVLSLLGAGIRAAGQAGPSKTANPSVLAAEERAISYLVEEVPRWFKENRCFSCHNNGDAARALYAAWRLSYDVPAQALAGTTEWLLQPLKWDNNRGNPAFSDKKLARIQFAASLAAAVEAGLIKDAKTLTEAAESLLPYQEQDGPWRVDADAAVGSPATYGACLATYVARRVLEKADSSRFEERISRADNWFRQMRAANTPDAAAIVLALHDHDDPVSIAKVRESLDLLVRGQASDGGWGPYPNSPPEAFDTALALLALAPLIDRLESRTLIDEGRAYLLRTQLPAGGWPETTRPSGGRSYAQHISTSGWATLALLETRGSRR